MSANTTDSNQHSGLNLAPVPHAHASPSYARVLRQGIYETRIAMSNGEQALVSIILPVMVLVALAFTGFLDQPDGTPSIDVGTPGVLALSVLSAGLTGQGIATGFDRRYGVLAFLSTTPLGPSGLLLGKTIAVILVQISQIAVIILIAVAMGWRPVLAGLGLTVVFLFVGALAFTSLGLLIAGTARPEATLALTNLLWVILGAVGGVVFPVREFFGSVVLEYLPSAALGDGLRSALIDGEFNLRALVTLAVWAIICGLATVKTFKWR